MKRARKTVRRQKRASRKNMTEKIIFALIMLVAAFFGYDNLNVGKRSRKAAGNVSVKKKPDAGPKKSLGTSVKNGSKEKYRVVRVSDGDTFTAVKIGSGDEIKVRMFSIDAPESRQEYGTQSKEYLSSLILDKDVVIEAKQKDRYGRVVANVYYKDENINEKMVKTGNAWWYEEYSDKNSPLEEYQKTAREKKLGLFAKKGYIAPWEWRRMKREQNAANRNAAGK